MKNRGKCNVILDMIMFVVMLALFCIKGQYHEPLAYTTGALVILHIVWHWKQYSSMVKHNIRNRNVILDMVMFLVMLSVFFVKDNLHETMAYLIGILVIVHAAWHWKQFKIMYCNLIPRTVYRYVVGTFAALLLAAVLAAPSFLTIDEPNRHGGGMPPDRAVHGERGHH